MANKTKKCPHCNEMFGQHKSRKNHMNTAGHGWLCPDPSCGDVRWAGRLELILHCKTVHHIIGAEPLRQRPGTAVTKLSVAHIAAAPAVTVPATTTDISQPMYDPSSSSNPTLHVHNLCGDNFSKVTAEHTNMTNLPTKCTLCNVSCFHIPTHYQYSHPSHFCDGCRRPFVSPSQRQGHICQPSSSPSKCLKPQTPAEETVAGLSATLAKDQACRAEEKSQNTLVQSLSKETHDPSTTSSTVAANTTHDEGIRVTIPAPTFVDVLIAYFLDELKNKHELKTDPANDPRAMQRLRKGSERVQLKLLEASQALLEIDNLFESIDFICLVTRATFEEPQASNYNPYSQGTVTNEHLSDIYSTAVAAPNSGTAEHEPGSWPEHAAVSLSGAAIADNSKLQATVNSPVDSESVASSLSDCDMLSEFYNVLSSADVSAPSSPLQISERLPHSSEDTGVDPLAFNSNGEHSEWRPGGGGKGAHNDI
ncbi:hypothetical protein BC629DRAFT_1605693 [Irpex lacteus]|nr:hypothetical protein BC629DRAFT_1605693 [Irpex lacteus]